MSSAVSDSPAPYLASIGLLSSGDSGAPATNMAGQISAHSDTDALQSLHLQCGRMMGGTSAGDNTGHWRSGMLRSTSCMGAQVPRSHASTRGVRRSSACTHLRWRRSGRRLRSRCAACAELAALRELHVRELEAVRRAADEEHTRLKEWCAAQLRAVADNRDAIVEHLAGQREGTAEASVAQLAKGGGGASRTAGRSAQVAPGGVGTMRCSTRQSYLREHRCGERANRAADGPGHCKAPLSRGHGRQQSRGERRKGRRARARGRTTEGAALRSESARYRQLRVRAPWLRRPDAR